MAIHIWTVLCRQSIDDKEDGSVSLIGVLEGLRFDPPIPEEAYANHPIQFGLGGFSAASLISLWKRNDRDTPEEFISRMSIIDPKNKVLRAVEIPTKLIDAKGHRQLYKFYSLEYTGPGVYFFKIQQQVESKGKKRWVTEAMLPLEMGMPD